MFIREATIDRAVMCPDGKKNFRLTASGPRRNCESIELRVDLFALEARGARTVHVPLSNVDYWEPDEDATQAPSTPDSLDLPAPRKARARGAK